MNDEAFGSLSVEGEGEEEPAPVDAVTIAVIWGDACSSSRDPLLMLIAM